MGEYKYHRTRPIGIVVQVPRWYTRSGRQFILDLQHDQDPEIMQTYYLGYHGADVLE